MVVLFAAALMVVTSATAFAAQSTVSKKFIDSNSWSYITAAKKDAKGSIATVLISQMYDSNKNVADYKKLKIQIGSNGAAASSTTVTKGTSTDITLNSGYTAAGTSLSFYGMGNDPALDCYIDGSFSAN